MRILIPANAFLPRLADGGRVEQNIDFLGVVPGLGVLVAVALDGDVGVGDEEFDVAGALFEFVVDGAGLVFGDVVEYVQVLFFGRGQLGVEFVGDHFVGAALEGEKFAGVVVAEADVVGYFDAAADGVEEGREEGLGVEVGGLDEDGSLGVSDG
jgi:hypothetical protein